MRLTKSFKLMMQEIEKIGNEESIMLKVDNSFICHSNIALHRYINGCMLRKKFKTKLCIHILGILFNEDVILEELKCLLAMVHLSGEKSQWNFKKEIEKAGLNLILSA